MFYLYFWLIFIVVGCGVCIVMLIVHQQGASNNAKDQEELNQKVKEVLKSKNFNTTKCFCLTDCTTCNKEDDYKKLIAVDADAKKICLIDYKTENVFIVDFDEILNYEIYENGSNATLGGNVGGFFGGIFGAETNGMCKELKLIIRLNKYDISHIDYEIVFDTLFNLGENKSNERYKQCVASLQEVVSFLEVVKNENANKKV